MKNIESVRERSLSPVSRVTDPDNCAVFAELMCNVEEAIRMMSELDQRLGALLEQMIVAQEIALRIEANLAQSSNAGE